jgi:hypothetical protein
MEGVVFVSLDVRHDDGASLRWREARLRPLRERLQGVGDFDLLLAGDVDNVEPTTTVAQLLASLDRKSADGELYFAREPSAGGDDGAVMFRGVIATWADYHELLFALIYATAAAAVTGSVARLSVMGDLDGTVLIVLVDAARELVTVRAADPQDLTESVWNERLGGIESLEDGYRGWTRMARRRARVR